MNTSQVCPIAACGGVDSAEAAAWHHRWLVVDDHGRSLGAADCPNLAKVDVAIRMGCLVLRAPGMLRLDIPMEVIEDDESVWTQVSVADRKVDVVDEGDVAATWFSKALDRPARLVKVRMD